MTKEEPKYRKDIFGSIGDTPTNENPLIPAATVVLLRTKNGQPEVLMLQKNKGIAFGGMWVFPGGKIDQGDHEENEDPLAAAKNAAVRETLEETGATLSKESFVRLSHWIPPATTPKRFSTWFFVAESDHHKIEVDGGEILQHRWINPAQALERHAADEIELAPPTWITLYQLTRQQKVSDILSYHRDREPMHFKTKLMFNDSKQPMAIWHGDSAYEHDNPNNGEKRHRLTMKKGGFIFENNTIDY